MAIKVGVCGAGAFARSFIPLFNAHPHVSEVVVADLIRERAEEQAARVGISRVLGSLDELCESDVDAIAIITQRQLHGPQVLRALRAGKHVYSAVPIAQTVDEVREIVQAVEETRLMYMTGETSYYYPATIYCRDRFKKGDFGDFVYGEGEYYHDMAHFYEPFRRSGGPDWRRVAGIPPMHYPTHSVSMILSITGARATSVACLGYEDHHEDGIFRPGANLWDNVFSNETALMRTSDGGMMRINEFRRIGWQGMSSVQVSLYGTKGCYEEQADSQVWVTINPEEMTALNDLLKCQEIPVAEAQPDVDQVVLKEFYSGVSKVHPIERLPAEFVGMHNGHLGSHQFLVDDFVKAVITNTLPPNHVWAAARYCVPGLVAHQSALNHGQMTDIPDLGDPPSDWEHLDPYVEL
jgi:predicted dehydrogenase